MAYTSFKIREIVDKAISHGWGVPEFQRGFVWKSTQVRDLAESLWLDYPVGSLLIWDSTGGSAAVQPKSVIDSKSPTLWLVDGQQRTTALCILSGRKPYWWQDGKEWNDLLSKYDVRFDIDTRQPPFFLVANAAHKKTKSKRYLPLTSLFSFNLESDQDQGKIYQLAKDIKSDGLCDGMDASEVKTRIERVCRIATRELVGITVLHELEDVVEIFARLNSKGTRVKEADIYLGIVAARSPGWVRETFMPFLDKLGDSGFDLSPNILFTSLTAVGIARVRFKQVEDSFWDTTTIKAAWEKCIRSWNRIVIFLELHGILTNVLLPSNAVLVTLSALFDKFPKADSTATFRWMMHALRYGRYSSSSSSSLEEDLKDIESSSSDSEAIVKLTARIRAIEPMTKTEFLRDYSESRFARLLLYVLIFKRQAMDWEKGSIDRVAFKGNNLLKGFEPQFHHIFPRKFLEGKVAPEKVEAIANIAIINADTNIKISNKDPLKYFSDYEITEEKRAQQFIVGPVNELTVTQYENWLDERSTALAEAANVLLGLQGA